MKTKLSVVFKLTLKTQKVTPKTPVENFLEPALGRQSWETKKSPGAPELPPDCCCH